MSKLALPLAATQFAQMAVMTTDVVMLGRLGKTALASAAIGNTVFYFAWMIGMGPMSAIAPMIAQALGARKNAVGEVRRIVRMGVWALLLLVAPLMPAYLLFGKPILLTLHQDPTLAANAGRFVAVLAIGLPFSLAYQGLRNVATALGKPASRALGDGSDHRLQSYRRLHANLRPLRCAQARNRRRGDFHHPVLPV